MAFIKKKEDFSCEVCQSKVVGSGFTNHCPACLWSRHVDKNPGDRKSFCLGLMEPIRTEQKLGKWRILFKCQKCGFERWNKAAQSDNLEKIIRLMN